jgi:protein-L-isoaspartate(D-aspartate) O-methyltransferase
VPREIFVPAELRHRAWEDTSLPIGSGQTISQPFVVARMCELLELRPRDRVLDVGTGSGYHAAVLAQLVAEVVSVERHAPLAQAARARLEALGYDSVEVSTVADGVLGAPTPDPSTRSTWPPPHPSSRPPSWSSSPRAAASSHPSARPALSGWCSSVAAPTAGR